MILSRHSRTPRRSVEGERLLIYCQTTGVSAAHATHCATYCTPCRPLIRAFSGWIRTPPPTRGRTGQNRLGWGGIQLCGSVSMTVPKHQQQVLPCPQQKAWPLVKSRSPDPPEAWTSPPDPQGYELHESYGSGGARGREHEALHGGAPVPPRVGSAGGAGAQMRSCERAWRRWERHTKAPWRVLRGEVLCERLLLETCAV